jgi:hypothetical protein
MNAIVRSQRRFDRRLYLGASLIFFALVFWTFARTFYLRPFFGASPLSALLHIHGAVMTGWVVLLVVQTSLICDWATARWVKPSSSKRPLAGSFIVTGHRRRDPRDSTA